MTMHFLACVLHSVIAISLAAAGIFTPLIEKSRIPLFRTTVANTDKAMRYDLAATSIGEFPMYALLLIVACVTSTSHALQIGPAGRAARTGVTGPNTIRWVEYAITASCMIFVVAALSGVRMLDTLLLLALSMAAVMVGGYNREAGGPDVVTYVSWALFAGIWAVIGASFFSHIDDAEAEGANPPWWLWIVVLAEFVMFAAFGLVSLMKVGPRQEAGYVGLSFGSKALLAGLVTAGLLSG